MGKIEDSLKAMNPLAKLFYHDIITIHMSSNRIDILRDPVRNRNFRLLFRIADNHPPNLFFIVPSNFEFIRKMDRFRTRKDPFIFSGENVFRYLHVHYPDCPSYQSGNLRECSGFIQTNFPLIDRAFSEEFLEETLNALIPTTGNREDEINGLLPAIDGWN